MKALKRLERIVCVLVLFALVVAVLLWSIGEDNSGIGDMPGDAYQAEGAGVQELHQIDWDALPETVVAWVEVPGTTINEPIAQATAGSPNAYLYEDALGQGAYGTPYIDWECSLDSDFVMVYGHHMSDGSVFADFANFIDGEYAREHDEIIIYERTGGVSVLKPMAIDIVNASFEKLVIPKPTEFKDRITSSDLVLDDKTLSKKLWAFTTCSYQTSNSRTVIYAGA